MQNVFISAYPLMMNDKHVQWDVVNLIMLMIVTTIRFFWNRKIQPPRTYDATLDKYTPNGPYAISVHWARACGRRWCICCVKGHFRVALFGRCLVWLRAQHWCRSAMTSDYLCVLHEIRVQRTLVSPLVAITE